MREYLYSLIRYVPDPERMEPFNIGVILQGEGRLDLKLNPNAARRKEVDTSSFQHWRRFLVEEVQGESLPLFQPKKSSPQFFRYLESLCEAPVLLSRPLYYSSSETFSFDEALEHVYRRLVAPAELSSAAEAAHPAGRFRQIAEGRDFLKRGMRKHAHVAIGSKKLWMAYRQVNNGELIAIDKVEVNSRIGSTANEIERLPRIRQDLQEFLNPGSSAQPTRFVLIADYLTKPFSEQSDEEFQAMSNDLEQQVDRLGNAGAEIVRTVENVELLARDIDAKLPPLPLAMAEAG